MENEKTIELTPMQSAFMEHVLKAVNENPELAAWVKSPGGGLTTAIQCLDSYLTKGGKTHTVSLAYKKREDRPLFMKKCPRCNGEPVVGENCKELCTFCNGTGMVEDHSAKQKISEMINNLESDFITGKEIPENLNITKLLEKAEEFVRDERILMAASGTSHVQDIMIDGKVFELQLKLVRNDIPSQPDVEEVDRMKAEFAAIRNAEKPILEKLFALQKEADFLRELLAPVLPVLLAYRRSSIGAALDNESKQVFDKMIETVTEAITPKP